MGSGPAESPAGPELWSWTGAMGERPLANCIAPWPGAASGPSLAGASPGMHRKALGPEISYRHDAGTFLALWAGMAPGKLCWLFMAAMTAHYDTTDGSGLSF